MVEVPSIATKIRFSEIMLYLSPLPPLLDGFHMAHLMVSIHFAAPRAGQHCDGLQQGRGEVQARKAEHRGSVVEHYLLLGVSTRDPPNVINIMISLLTVYNQGKRSSKISDLRTNVHGQSCHHVNHRGSNSSSQLGVVEESIAIRKRVNSRVKTFSGAKPCVFEGYRGVAKVGSVAVAGLHLGKQCRRLYIARARIYSKMCSGLQSRVTFGT